MSYPIGIFTCIALLTSFGSAAPAAVNDDKLPPYYQKWLNEEVVYIITTEEKSAFLKLESDELRDRFIEVFWEQRDPTPGTLRNEFREEHYKRIEFANKHFGPRQFKTGWRTERGRVYILLGEPKDRLEYSSDTMVYPCELWFYSADDRIPGVTHFYLIFFKRGGAGDFVIYHPKMDGPQQLIWKDWGQSEEEVLESIGYLSKELALASISLNPMDPGNTMAGEMLINKIDAYPETLVDSKWATDFVETKGRVDVEYTFTVMNIDSLMTLFVPLDGRQQLHFAFMLKPEEINIGKHEDHYYAAFEITPSLAGEGGQILYQYVHSPEITWDEEEYLAHKSKPVVFSDVMPVIPGQYNLTIRIRNKVSKEYFLITKKLEVPRVGPDNFQMADLLLNQAYNQVTDEPGATSPFRFFNVQYEPNLSNEFAPLETIYIFSMLLYPPQMGGVRTVGDILFEFNVYLDEQLVKQLTHTVSGDRLNPMGIHYLSYPLALEGLEQGHYRLEVIARDNKAGLATVRSKLFSIEEPGRIQRATILPLRKNLILNGPELLFERGKELLNAGMKEEAMIEFVSVLNQKPDHIGAAMELGEILIESGRFEEAYSALRSVESLDPNNRRLVMLLARAADERGNSAKAIGYYQRLLFIDPEDVEVLNALADLYERTGKPEEARKCRQKSLEVRPDQPRIKSLLEQ